MPQYAIAIRTSPTAEFIPVYQDLDAGTLGLGTCAQNALETYAAAVGADWYAGLWLFDQYEYQLEQQGENNGDPAVQTVTIVVTPGALGIPRYERIDNEIHP